MRVHRRLVRPMKIGSCSPAARHRSAWGQAAIACSMTAILLALIPRGALAQTIDAKLWTVNDLGAVEDIVRVGSTIYIGGSFTEVGPCTGQGLPVSATTGEPIGPYPRVGGSHALARLQAGRDTDGPQRRRHAHRRLSTAQDSSVFQFCRILSAQLLYPRQLYTERSLAARRVGCILTRDNHLR